MGEQHSGSRYDRRPWWRRMLTDETRRQQVFLAVACVFAIVGGAGAFVSDFGASVPVMFGGGAATGIVAQLRYDPYAETQPTRPTYLRSMSQAGRTAKDLVIALVLAYLVACFAHGPLLAIVVALFVVVGMLMGVLAVVVLVWGIRALVSGLREGSLGRNTSAASAAVIITVLATFACSIPAIRQTGSSSRAVNLLPMVFLDGDAVLHPVLLWIGRLFAVLMIASFVWMWNAYYGSRRRQRGRRS